MKNESKLNRRRFAEVLAGVGTLAPAVLAQEATPPAGARPAPPPQNQPAAGAPNPNTSQQRRGTMEEIPPFRETLTFTRSDVAPKVQPFPMTQVRVTGGPYKQAQDWNRGYMQRLAGDRLTRNFLLNAGLPSSAKPLGGWEQDTPGRAGRIARSLHGPLPVGIGSHVRLYWR